MDIKLPDGTVLRNVPEGTTKADILAKLGGQHGLPMPEQPPGGNSPAPVDNGQAESPFPEWVQQADSWARENVPGMDAIAELASSANRSVTELVDFLGPDSINAVLSLAGSEKRVPTVTGALEGTGIEGGYMEPGAAREVVQAGGALIPAAAGIVPVQRAAGTVGSSILDLLGAGSSAVAAPTAAGRQVGRAAFREALPPTPQSKAARAAELPLKRQTGDLASYGYRLDETGRAVADPVQREAGKQGFGEGFVSMVHAAPKKAREKFGQMVKIVERGRQNLEFQAEHRPQDVIGESLADRIDVVWGANRVAASRLNHVAKGLKSESIDVQPAVDNFLAEIDDLGVKFDPKSGAIDFRGSDIEGLEGLEGFWKRFLGKLRDRDVANAYDVHRIKKFIDEQVSYGAKQEGLGGNTQRIVKKLRHDLDTMLDEAFPAYNNVNTQYAETRRAIDDLQEIAGKRANLMDSDTASALGTLSRRLLGNTVSRVPLRKAVRQLDATAKKYVTPGNEIVPYEAVNRATTRGKILTPEDFDDGINAQLLFADELESMFGTHAKTSLQGDTAKVADRAVDYAAGQQTAVGLAAEAGKSGIRRLRGINEENAMKAIKDLLREGQ